MAPVRFDGVVVFADGRTHLVRITPTSCFQWGATQDQLGDVADALRAMSAALAATLKTKDDR
ncbi:hypothetical protein SAMN05421810_10198 [Amycolatopsis arida]|uniref:Uncharacterized protein n=1 Tax=Amycolatopsis arida TaxID=587909 RepID=A0A1I5KEA8_9PSEU|nr:hypothetical protein [Amycolatopsis arida]TDX96994.1 hypothetical protein CLV69_10296 [Amycolatopsis arida]SFO82956.1 hypothetical protein SAMN05421810_10198 [Amycolatopsis arida]